MKGTAVEASAFGSRAQRDQVARAMVRVTESWPNAARCPVLDILDRIGDTWTLLVVVRLGVEPLRFRELLRQVSGVSQRMLTVTLRGLERDGLVKRTVLDGSPPGVEYALSALGVSLLLPIQQLADWALAHDPAIRAARARFDGHARLTVGSTIHRLTPRGAPARAAR